MQKTSEIAVPLFSVYNVSNLKFTLVCLSLYIVCQFPKRRKRRREGFYVKNVSAIHWEIQVKKKLVFLEDVIVTLQVDMVLLSMSTKNIFQVEHSVLEGQVSHLS